MLIDGRLIAQKILERLKSDICKLKIKPHLVVILVGEDPVWKAYVAQKLKKGEEIGVRVTINQQPGNISQSDLLKVIEKFNNDPDIDGIIIQRPLPPQINNHELTLAVYPKKDVDGFHPKSYHPMPVAAAVIETLKEIFSRLQLVQGATFAQWLKSKNIVVIGKGETAGKPTAIALNKLGSTPEVIDSKTPDPKKLIKNADVVISCVGKPKIIKPEMIKKGVILIGIGLHRDIQGKLAGDYDQETIKEIASFYTPIPGGIGPINVACLLENLVAAAKLIESI